MNKKLKCFLVIAMMFLVCFSCNKNSDSADKTENVKAETNDPTDDLDRYKLKMSLEEKQEDYEYFWDFVYNGWPFIEVCQRKGVELEKIKKEYSKKLEELSFKTDYNDFYDDLCYEIAGKNVIGHFWPLTYTEYSFYKNYKMYPMINNKGLKNKKILSFYSSIPTDPYYQKDSLKNTTKRFTFHYIKNTAPEIKIIKEGKIAYVKLHTFFYLDKESADKYYSAIEELLKTTKDYKHLIIDITDNLGGLTGYWKTFVGLNLKFNQKIFFTRYGLYNENEYTKIYIDKFLSSAEVNKIPIKNIPYRENANTKKNTRAYIYKSFIKSVYERGEKDMCPIKTRKNWLLINESTFSAADQFASFCKASNWATLIGSNTMGGGMDVDEPKSNTAGIISLPKSGMLIRLDILYDLNKEGYCNDEVGTIPDIYTAEGKTALETCLDAIEEWDKKN